MKSRSIGRATEEHKLGPYDNYDEYNVRLQPRIQLTTRNEKIPVDEEENMEVPEESPKDNEEDRTPHEDMGFTNIMDTVKL